MSYTKYTWQTGEIITADKLNHMEDGIDSSVSSELQVILLKSDWNNNSQTVSALGVTANNSVIVAPYPEDHVPYNSHGIYCLEQSAGALTFVCTSIPDTDIRVNVLIVR